MSKLIFASTISEIQQSDVFMTVKARICEAPEANLNGARVTEAFIDEIVGNDARYVGLPLYADVKALTSGNYNRLGHLYDVRTGEFHSTQIGSFYQFEKQTWENGCALIGYARIPKRNKKLSKAISELFTDNALKFSFELSVGEYTELDDNTILIDASENNYLEGTAIVTYPACEDAVALELVAQKNTDETRKGESEMAEVENKAEVVETEATQPELAETVETKVENNVTESAENVTNIEAEEEIKEDAACKKKEKAEEETAAVYVDNRDVEVHEQYAYDTETGKSVNQRVTIETSTSQAVEGTLVETVDGIHVAETEVAAKNDDSGNIPSIEEEEQEEQQGTNGQEEETQNSQVETPSEETPSEETQNDTPETPAPEVTGEKKTSEEMIAELIGMINELKSEIAELKERKQIAEAKPVVGEINPFMGDLNTQGKYSLLEKESKTTSYSLLEKA